VLTWFSPDEEMLPKGLIKQKTAIKHCMNVDARWHED